MKKWEVFKDERSIIHLYDMINYYHKHKDRLEDKKYRAVKNRALTLIEDYLKHFNIPRSEIKPNIFD